MAIITGMIGLIVFGGFIEFAYWGLRESTIRTQLGHIQLYTRGYSEKGVADPGKYLIGNYNAIEKVVLAVPEVLMVTGRLTFSGLISTGEKTLICKGVGIDPKKEEEMTSFETIVDGEQLAPDMRDGGVVGIELMKAIGAKVGDYLTIVTTTTHGSMNAVEFKVVGVAQTGMQDYDSVFVKLPIKLVQKLLDTDKVEKVIVLLKNTEDIGKAAAMIGALIEKNKFNLEYKLWSDLAEYYHKVVALYNGMFGAIKVIIGVIVLFSIVNTMSMSAFERVREIGTMRAMGNTRADIMKLFITEGVFIGIMGGILGIVAGAGVAYAINMTGGIDIPPPPGMSRGYTTLILLEPAVILQAFLLIVAVSGISSIYPAFKASRLKIVDALQHI